LSTFCKRSVEAAITDWIGQAPAENRKREVFWNKLSETSEELNDGHVYSPNSLRKMLTKEIAFPPEKGDIVEKAARSMGVSFDRLNRAPPRRIVNSELLDMSIMLRKTDLEEGQSPPNRPEPDQNHDVAIDVKVDTGTTRIDFGSAPGQGRIYSAQFYIEQGSIRFVTAKTLTRAALAADTDTRGASEKGDPENLKTMSWVVSGTPETQANTVYPLGRWSGVVSRTDKVTFTVSKTHIRPRNFEHLVLGPLEGADLGRLETQDVAEAISQRIEEVLMDAFEEQCPGEVTMATVPFFPDEDGS